MSGLANEFQQELAPINRQYSGLWDKFIAVLRDYGTKLMARMNEAIMPPEERSNGLSLLNGAASECVVSRSLTPFVEHRKTSVLVNEGPARKESLTFAFTAR